MGHFEWKSLLLSVTYIRLVQDMIRDMLGKKCTRISCERRNEPEHRENQSILVWFELPTGFAIVDGAIVDRRKSVSGGA